VVRPYLVWGVWFASDLLLGGTGLYLDLFCHNRQPVIPGVYDLNSSPEPSVEWVAGAVHSMGGRIGPHMSLWLPPRDFGVWP
jgi:hypothetical protein